MQPSAASSKIPLHYDVNGIAKGLYSPESGRQIKINQLINIKLIKY